MLTILKAFQGNKSWFEVITDIKEEVLEDDVDMEVTVIQK
jgi:hypothetical protein